MTDTSKFHKIVKEYLPYLLIIILVLLIKRFVISPIRVNGNSMYKTLHEGDIMILNIIGYNISNVDRFDIVVVNEGNELIIKRVIGLPGETITYDDNKLYVNNKLVKDKYGYGDTGDFSYKVPKNSYFVLGDNRGNSLDSRVFGPFKKKQIIGKTNFIIFPFNRFGKKQ